MPARSDSRIALLWIGASITLFGVLAVIVAHSRGPVKTEPSAPHRSVILYNDDAQTVMVAKDMEAFWAAIDYVRSGSDGDHVRMKAAKVDGRLFEVENGTRALVYGETPIPGAKNNAAVLSIMILNGPHSTDFGFCFSSLTRTSGT